MSIAENIKQVRADLPAGVQLVCVSKYHTETEILQAYSCGEKVFGESRANELERKALALPDDICWHFIGHLQRNKAKLVCKYAGMIQSVDSWRLLQTINDVTEKPIDVLIETHVANETTKTGLSPEDVLALFDNCAWRQLSNIKIRGIMGMATLTDNQEQIRNEFRRIRLLFESVKTKHFPADPVFNILSMGMSGDYPLAIEEGSTMIRIGSMIFN